MNEEKSRKYEGDKGGAKEWTDEDIAGEKSRRVVIKCKNPISKGLLGIVAGLSLAGNVMAANVGDNMINLEQDKYRTHNFGKWRSPNRTKQGLVLYKINIENREEKYNGAYNICNDKTEKLPFGIYDPTNKILYLDNNPTDGIIDKIVNSPANQVYEDAPDCKS